MKLPSHSWLVCIASLLPVAASATEPAPLSGDPQSTAHATAYTHDGFFLNLSAGAGSVWGQGTGSSTYAYSKDSEPTVTYKVNKPSFFALGAETHFELGFCPTHNLALFYDQSAFVGSASNGHQSLEGAPGFQETSSSLTLVGMGVGLAYYFMPANLFLRASAGLAFLGVDQSGNLRSHYGIDAHSTDAQTNSGGVGPQASLAVGREWWVSENWGLGVSARFRYAHINGESGISYFFDNPPPVLTIQSQSGYHVESFSLSFSATFN